MIEIAVVDDLQSDRDQLSDMLSEYAGERGLEWNITCFESGETLLDGLTAGQYQLVFLDILMGGIDGMETAARLRAFDTDALLVFVTTEDDYAVDAYELDAVAFLVKPPVRKKFDRMMARLEKKLEKDAVLELTENNAVFELPAGAVLYAEVIDHDLALHTKDGVYSLRMTMEELKPLLPSDGRFFECHRGVILNLDRVKSLEKQVAVMANGDRLPVSRRKKKELVDAYVARNFARVRGM